MCVSHALAPMLHKLHHAAQIVFGSVLGPASSSGFGVGWSEMLGKINDKITENSVTIKNMT